MNRTTPSPKAPNFPRCTGSVRRLSVAILFFCCLLVPFQCAEANTFSPVQSTFSNTPVGATSQVVAVTLVAQASGTVSSSVVLTEGVATSGSAEFTLVDAGTCNAAALAPGQSCSVDAVFAPRFPGLRHGAIQLKTSSGQLLASTLISALGQGSLPVLLPAQIDTVVGNGQWFYQGDNVPATQAPIYLPSGLAVDADGNLFLADTINNRVRRVDAVTHNITTIAGNGSAGSGGEGVAATQASLNSPSGLALDGAGNLFIADTGNSTVRRVDAITGIITTVAGQAGLSGYAGDGGAATAARLSSPQGLVVSSAGDLIIADTSNAAVRVVTASDGLIQTIAGTGVAGYNGDHIPATSAQLSDPSGVAIRNDGAIAIADLSNNRVRLFTVGGNIATIVGDGSAGYTGDGGNAAQAEVQGPAAVAFDPAGDLLIADSVNNCVRLVYGNPALITTLAGTPADDHFSGDGGPDNQARMHGPDGLVFDAQGNLWVSDRFNNRVRKVTGSQLTIGPYPTMKVGRVSQPVAEAMINGGNQPLTLASPVLQQAALDTASTTCGQGAMAPSVICNMGVQFAPTQVGPSIDGSVTWNSNAPNVTPVDQLYGQVLSVEPTSVVITSSANPGLLGQPVTLTATVTSADTHRSGTVDFVEGGTTWCSAVALAANGTAACRIPSLSLGTHTFVANYSGDNNNAASSSPAYQEVIKQSAALALGISPTESTITNNVTLTLSAATSSGTPTGTVVFYDGTTSLATVPLDANGSATWSTTSFTLGKHVLTAQYSGDSATAAGTSSAKTLQVDQAATTSVLSSSNNDASVGTSITLTASILSHNGPAPTGTVRFQDGSSVLGEAALDANDSATLTISSLRPGNHTLTAIYLGDTDDATSTSAPVSQTVEQISTVTTLASDADPSSAGASVQLTATVNASPTSGSQGALTGLVSFQESGNTFGSAAVNASGQAALSVNKLSVGSHAITALYSGDTNYASSHSSVFTQVVQQTASTVSLSSSSTTALKGKPITLSVVVTSPTGTPTGSVTFRDEAGVLGSATLNASGQGSLATSSLPSGMHTLTVSYSGDGNYLPATSAPVQQTINLAQPTLVLAGPSTAVDAGVAMTLNAALGSPGISPSGTLMLSEGTVLLASQTVTNVGTFTFKLSQLPVGTHVLIAGYSGDANTASVNSSAITVTVQQAPTSTGIVSSVNPLTLGQLLTLTAKVQSDGPNLQGPVRFYDGSALLGTASVDATGSASISSSDLALGTHTLTASFQGDVNHVASTSVALAQLVVQSAALSVSSSINPSVSGNPVTFTGVIIGTPVPTGSLRFSDGTSVLATVPLGSDGAAAFTTTALGIGAHTITVNYTGDVHFSTAEAQVQQVVLNASTSVNLVADSNPAVFGQPLHLLVSVGSNGGSASGTANILDAGRVIGSVQLNAEGTSSFVTTTLSPGTHTLIAAYAGDGRANPSASSPLQLSVKQRTSLAVTSGANPAQTLSPITLTATVSNAGVGSATGVVTFTEGATTLGTAVLDAAGHASLQMAQMSAGSHTISATYPGDDGNFAAASASYRQDVILRPTTTTVTGTSSDPSNPQQITLIAVVHAEGSAPPSGTVVFTSGSVTLGASAVDDTGVAAITVIFNTPTQQVTASYPGDASYAASQSASTPITAGSPAQFTVSLSSADITLASHQHTTITVELASLKGFTDDIALGCLGLPYAATCTFDHSQLRLTADGKVTASLVIDTGNPLGAGSKVSENRQKTRTLLCLSPAGLLLVLCFAKLNRRRLPSLLLLALSLIAAGSAIGCGGLQVSGTPPGTYNFRVIGTGQGSNTTETQTVNLVVTQ